MTKAPIDPATPAKRRGIKAKVIGGLAALVLIGSCMAGGGDKTATAPTSTATASKAPTGSPDSAAPTTTPAPDTTTSPAAPATTPATTATPTPTPTPAPTAAEATTSAPAAPVSSQTVTLTCTGTELTGVTITRDGDDASITWHGTPPAGAETTGFYVDVFDATGNIARQLGKKITNGEPTQFFFDMGTAQNVDLPAEGTGITNLQFPGAFAELPGKFHADGAVTQDGQDIGECH